MHGFNLAVRGPLLSRNSVAAGRMATISMRAVGHEAEEESVGWIAFNPTYTLAKRMKPIKWTKQLENVHFTSCTVLSGEIFRGKAFDSVSSLRLSCWMFLLRRVPLDL